MSDNKVSVKEALDKLYDLSWMVVRLAEDDPMNFSVGKVVHDLIAKELDEDIKKQILEEDSK